jgi:hypothetical protein
MRRYICFFLASGLGIASTFPCQAQAGATDGSLSGPSAADPGRRPAKSSLEWMQPPHHGRVTQTKPGPIDEKAARLAEGRRKFFETTSGFEPTSRWDGVPAVFDRNGMPSVGVGF